MPEELLNTEDVLKALQIEENELEELVTLGDIRPVPQEKTMKYRRTDVFKLKREREEVRTIVMKRRPPEVPDESLDDLLVSFKAPEELD